MTITHRRTNLSKYINPLNYNPTDLNLIYEFYTNHKDYKLTIKE